jgi:hypothetical protein
MKKKTTKRVRYPDISDLLRRKEEGRKALSKLTFGEKLERMEALRENVRPFKEAREARRKKTGSTDIRK